jgi:hypothetical protein
MINMFKYAGGQTVAYWLRRYATSRKVTGAKPDEVIVFNLPNAFNLNRPWGLINFWQKRVPETNNKVSGE